MNLLKRVLFWISYRSRSKSRAFDAKFLWPEIAKLVGPHAAGQFMAAAKLHCSFDPAWRGYEHEWIGTPQSPAVWWREHMQKEPKP